jgi:hypothetical protein
MRHPLSYGVAAITTYWAVLRHSPGVTAGVGQSTVKKRRQIVAPSRRARPTTTDCVSYARSGPSDRKRADVRW